MSLSARMAARSEIKLRSNVLAAIAEVAPQLATGPITLPCHIVDEVHNGFCILTDGENICIYRCQGSWWAYEVDTETLESLASPQSGAAMRLLSKATPVCLGPINVGIRPFAYQVAAAASS